MDPDDLDTYAEKGKDGEQVNWNTKVTPVPFGYQVNRFGSFLTQEGVRESKNVPYNEAMRYLNEVRGKGDEYEIFLKQLQRYNNSESTSASGVEGMWKTVLDDAEASGENAMDLLQRGTKIPKDGDGGGRYTGPVATTTLANERDLRATADAVASTVIGRGITDEEFQKVLKRVRVAERAEPAVSIPGVGSNVSMPGLSAEGRQDIIRDSLMKGPEAEDYGKATKMMDLFYKTLEARPEGA
jgi:hypothetical protein